MHIGWDLTVRTKRSGTDAKRNSSDLYKMRNNNFGYLIYGETKECLVPILCMYTCCIWSNYEMVISANARMHMNIMLAYVEIMRANSGILQKRTNATERTLS